MAPTRFGTDGVRGVANEDLTAELALALGRATARVLPAPTFVVGRDTRRSGPMLQAAFSAGLATEGADVIDLGVLPTPGVAAAAARRAVPGAVISASHNPFGDNGIKLFSLFGTKLPTDVEQEIERELDAVLADPRRPPRRPTGHGVGRLSSDPGARQLYGEQLMATIDGRGLDGVRIVVDCANGAASEVAPWVFADLGAVVTTLHDAPDGANINDACGSTDPTELARAVVERGADVGLALDGDADRVIAVDESGTIVDGDVLLALFALDLAERDRLTGNTVVVTVMTNLGFRLAMEGRGIDVRETDVGDRHVLAALDADGLSLGGEQSGHIIFRSLSTTGDGILTGIALVDLMRRAGALAGRPVERPGRTGAPTPRQRAHPPTGAAGRLRRSLGGGGEGGSRARTPGAGAPAAQRDRATGPDHGRGAPRSPGQRRGRAARRRRGVGPGAERTAGPRLTWVPMCGIIGVTGEADALPVLLGALHQLEYRGYDSAGVAMVVDGAIWRERAAGGTDSVAKLAELTGAAPAGPAQAAIGHTRWATHGSPTPENAHPHADCTGRLALVHNGIIENHAALPRRARGVRPHAHVGHRHRGDGAPH